MALIGDVVSLGWWIGRLGLGRLCVMSQVVSCAGYLLLSTVGISAGPDPWPYTVIALLMVGVT